MDNWKDSDEDHDSFECNESLMPACYICGENGHWGVDCKEMDLSESCTLGSHDTDSEYEE